MTDEALRVLGVLAILYITFKTIEALARLGL